MTSYRVLDMNSVWNSISVLNRVLNIDCSSNTDLCLGLQAGATRTRFRFRGCRGLRDNRPCSSSCHLPLDSCLGHRIADHFASSYHHIPARRKHHVTHFPGRHQVITAAKRRLPAACVKHIYGLHCQWRMHLHANELLPALAQLGGQ